MPEKRDQKFKIAILAYGSLTLNLTSPFYEEPLLVSTPFEETPLEIWASFQALTALEKDDESRVCLLALSHPNEIARKTPLYHAQHQYEDLNAACLNFMKREGMTHLEQIAILYQKGHISPSTYSSYCFDKKHIEKIEEWLLFKGYDVALMAQFHPHFEVEKVLEFLKSSKGVQQRTLNYYHRLPPKTKAMHLDALHALGLFSDEKPEETTSY